MNNKTRPFAYASMVHCTTNQMPAEVANFSGMAKLTKSSGVFDTKLLVRAGSWTKWTIAISLHLEIPNQIERTTNPVSSSNGDMVAISAFGIPYSYHNWKTIIRRRKDWMDERTWSLKLATASPGAKAILKVSKMNASVWTDLRRKIDTIWRQVSLIPGNSASFSALSPSSQRLSRCLFKSSFSESEPSLNLDLLSQI